MRAPSLLIFVAFLSLGIVSCSNPYRIDDPDDAHRIAVDANGLSGGLFPYQFGYFDGILETEIHNRIDSPIVYYSHQAEFYNLLGTAFAPRAPFTVTVNGTSLFDTLPWRARFIGNVPAPFAHTEYWDILGGPDEPSIHDSIVTPDDLRLIYPTDSNDTLPRSPFSILYDAGNADSIRIHILTLVIEKSSRNDYFVVPNTGHFDLDADMIARIPTGAFVLIDLVSLRAKEIRTAGKLFLLRSMATQTCHFTLSP